MAIDDLDYRFTRRNRLKAEENTKISPKADADNDQSLEPRLGAVGQVASPHIYPR